MLRKIIFILIIIPQINHALEEKYGVKYGHKNYTSIHLGNINILLTAAHGGYLEPTDIANRTSDTSGNLKGDFNTKPLSFLVREHLHELFVEHQNLDVTPFFVYNDLIR